MFITTGSSSTLPGLTTAHIRTNDGWKLQVGAIYHTNDSILVIGKPLKKVRNEGNCP